MLKAFDTCPKKFAARLAFLSYYEGGEYWTMSGLNEGPGCEFEQSGVRAELFHGVDIDPAVIERNERAYPKTNWHHGDLCEVMMAEAGDIGLVNIDTCWEPPRTVKYAANMLRLEPRVLVLNTVLRQWRNGRTTKPQAVLDLLGGTAAYQNHAPALAAYHEYAGTGKGGTVMGTFVFRLAQRLSPSLSEAIRPLDSPPATAVRVPSPDVDKFA